MAVGFLVCAWSLKSCSIWCFSAVAACGDWSWTYTWLEQSQPMSMHYVVTTLTPCSCRSLCAR
jgi:hypothetical protein